MRAFSTIGWFMCQAIGTMQLDRDASPLGLVARAWAADVGSSHVEVGIDWGRRSGKSERMRQMKRVIDDGHIEMHRLSTQNVELCKTCRNLGWGESLCISCQRVHELSTQVKPSMKAFKEKPDVSE